MGVYRPVTFLVVRALRDWIGSRPAKHRLDEPARLSLSMVASLQSLPPFHPASSFQLPVLSFQFARETTEQGNLSPCGQLLQPCLHF